MPPVVILVVDHDASLLTRRSSTWNSAGFLLTTASSIRQAIDHLQAGDFDLVLLGESISPEHKERLTFLIRASGTKTPVISIAAGPGDCDSFADATLHSDSSRLLSAMSELLAARTAQRPQSVPIRNTT